MANLYISDQIKLSRLTSAANDFKTRKMRILTIFGHPLVFSE